MKVTTITPVFNNELYLEECIESLLNQTYSDREHIFVNDGSRDGSENILNKYAHLPGVKIIRKQQNQGIAAAYNDAFEMAQGEIIVLLDADDYAFPERLENTVQAFIKDPNIDFVYSAMALVDRFGEPFNLKAELPKYVTNLNLFQQLLRRNFFTGSALAFRNRSIFRFNLDVLCCDYYLCLKLAENGGKFAYLEDPQIKYRIHGKNTSGQVRMFTDFVKVQNQYPDSFLEEKLKEDNVSYPVAQITLGIMSFLYKRDDLKAFEYFSKSIRYGEQDPYLFFYLGCIHYKWGHLDQSFIFFRNAYELAPTKFQIVHNYGVLSYLLEGNKQKFLDLLGEAYQLQPYYLGIKRNISKLSEGLYNELSIIQTLTDDDAIYLSYCQLKQKNELSVIG